ncbi:uncharacterized protein DFL_002002 [Arthrobotrys flagrans]|uniref:Peptidase A1 domain-containing protein n=1 Tax=Arthrobotrys flagrans TaxID=97331 RepID=A0A437A9G8_ARTFL|nr:hypothetical protein DFL_002002 [Arthrobotrys flagrans]
MLAASFCYEEHTLKKLLLISGLLQSKHRSITIASPNIHEYVTQNVTFVDGLIYCLPATIGEQEVNLIIDTGSSDTWTIQSDFDCIDLNGVANAAKWKGNGISSGIPGLGYPGSIPSAPGHQPYDWIPKIGSGGRPRSSISIDESDIDFDCHDAYPSFIQSLAAQGYAPLFSINLEETRSDWDVHGDKPQEGGFIAFGGILHVKRLGLPFGKAKMNPRFNESTCASDIRQTGYEFEIDTVLDGDTVISNQKGIAQIDTGASVMVFPYRLYLEFWKRVYPLQSLEASVGTGGLWRIRCNATMPDLGSVIGGVVIKLDRNELIKAPIPALVGKAPASEEMCFMNVIANPWSEEVVLGVPFLHGAPAVYDLENNAVRIAKKSSSDPFHIPTRSDEALSAGLVGHPPPGGNTSNIDRNWGVYQTPYTGTQPVTIKSTSIRVISVNGSLPTPAPPITVICKALVSAIVS